MSWYRSFACGLRPDTPLAAPVQVEVDRGSRLMVAADPVLTELARSLEGTRYSLLLADREACIVDRRFSDSRLERALDGIGAMVGRRFTEETTGTNAIATALELSTAITVNGHEHFMEPMKRFSCYGQPIRTPASKRVEAVLQVTGPVEDANPLWAPIIARAAQDIGQRLLIGERLAEQRMLTAFQEATRRSDRMIVMLGADLVLASPTALGVLDPADHGLLRDLAEQTIVGIERTHRVTLASGGEADLRFGRISDAPEGVLFEVAPVEPRRHAAGPPRPRQQSWSARHLIDLAEYRRGRVRLLIAGEPGSGRSRAAEILAGHEPLTRFDATEIEEIGLRRWTAGLAAGADRHRGLLLIENIHLLPLAAAGRVAQLVEASDIWFALTSAPVAELDPEHARLAALCAARMEIPPLRYLRDELPELVRTLIGSIDPDPVVRFETAVWQILFNQSWPANVRELESLLRHVLEHRESNLVTVNDLPTAYRASRRGRRLSRLEQAEHDTIARALRDCAGNKSRAARLLGIGRTTLYTRIRYLGVSA